MGFIHITVDALGEIGQRRAEGEHLFRLPAAAVQKVYARQCTEFQQVKVGGKALAHRLVPGGIFVDILQQIGHADVGRRLAGVEVALDDFACNGERRVVLLHGGGKVRVSGDIAGVLVDNRVILVLNGHRAQDVAAFARHVHLGDSGAHPDGDGVRCHDPLLDRIGKDHVEVGAFPGQFFQRGAVPLAGVAAVDKLHLRVGGEVLFKPAQRLFHRYTVCFGKSGKVGARHSGKLGHLVVVHAGVAEAGNIQVQLFVGVEAELPAEGGFILKIPVKFRPQKIHHDGAGHGGIFGVHAVGLQAGGGALAPAGLHAALGVAVHVEPVTLLLRIGKHLLPMQVDDLVAFADVVVDVAVDGLVIIHAAGDQHFRLIFAEKPQVLGVQQLADLGGIAAALQLQLEQQVALIFAHSVLVQNQEV